MEKNSSTSTHDFTLHLQGELGIANAASLQKRLVKTIQAHKQVTIHLSDVHTLDLSCLQLLHAARKMAAEQAVNLKITAVLPEEQQQLVTRAGFGYLLQAQASR